MSSPTLRAYKVLLDDAVLVRVPDLDTDSGHEQSRHILIDVGNILGDGRPQGDATLHKRTSKNWQVGFNTSSSSQF